MDYKTVFDISVDGYKGLIIVGILFIFYGYFLKQENKTDKFKSWFFRTFFIGAIVWTVFASLLTLLPYAVLIYCLQTGKYDVTEGTVTNFIPMPYHGHSDERFVVNGKYFKYSQFDMGPGFNHTKSHGGPIDEGVKVRISHVGRIIIKLEIVK